MRQEDIRVRAKCREIYTMLKDTCFCVRKMTRDRTGMHVRQNKRESRSSDEAVYSLIGEGGPKNHACGLFPVHEP
jgi:hypothetical protein